MNTRIIDLLDAIGPDAVAPIEAILKEYLRACKKHPDWPDDAVHASAILNEESGELTQAALDFHYSIDVNFIDRKNMLDEAAQCGAMALRFLMHIQRYKTG